MIELRKEQQKVAAYSQGFLAVPAVPGAGKTTTLAVLAAGLIKEGRQKPGRILIVTCMNSAVANFKSRIAKFLKEHGLPPSKGYEVKTLHSLAVKIIRKKPEALHINGEFHIIDECLQKDVIRRESLNWIYNNSDLFRSALESNKRDNQEWLKDKEEKWQEKFSQIVFELIKCFKAYKLDREQLESICRRLPSESIVRWVTDVYFAYQRFLYVNGLLDFEDLIVKAVDLLKNDLDLLSYFQEEWTYIFEDEAQDSNPLQEEMLFLLASKNHNLVRVGDLNQAIMSTFTTSDPKLFWKYCQMPDTEILPITCSSRSSQKIIDLANYLVSWCRDFHPEFVCREALEEQLIQPAPPEDKFPNPSTDNSRIACLIFDKRDDEIKEISKHLKDYVERNQNKTIAILSPTNDYLEEIADELAPLGVDYQELTRYPQERRRAMKILGEIVDYLAHPHHPHRLLAVLVRLEFITDEEEKLFLPFLREVGLENLLYPLTWEIGEEEISERLREGDLWNRFSQGLEQIKFFLSISRVQPENLIIYLAQELNFTEEDLAIAQRIALEIRQMMILHPDWRLSDLAQELKSVNNSFNHFANIVYERRGYEPKAGQVDLVTYHKAKGMEWDTVYLTNIVPKKFPTNSQGKFHGDLYYLKPQYKNPIAFAKAELSYLLNGKKQSRPREASNQEVIAERLRMLYVGITRARKNLLLSGYYEDEWGKRSDVSDYIKAMGKFLKEKRDV